MSFAHRKDNLCGPLEHHVCPLRGTVTSSFALMVIIIYDYYVSHCVCCISFSYLGVVVHVVVMPYKNMAFNDEAQVYIVGDGTMP